MGHFCTRFGQNLFPYPSLQKKLASQSSASLRSGINKSKHVCIFVYFSDNSMRYANSLESLDAVTTSIQQARAYSLSQALQQHEQQSYPVTSILTSKNEAVPSAADRRQFSTQNNNFFARYSPAILYFVGLCSQLEIV